jgi:8-oxo-dGTP diphosphatase
MIKPIQVVCAIILYKEKVLCAQRSEQMSLPLKWEFPGGKIEQGESPEQCLVREIKEELNIEIHLEKRLASNMHDYGKGKQIELIPFIASFVRGPLQIKEHKSVTWEKVGELKKLDWAAADIPIVEEFSNWYEQNF